MIDDLIATLAHDLKIPLTSVRLFADMLLNQADEINAATRAHYLAVISSEAERMSRMVTNIADYQNIASASAVWRDEATDVVRVAALCAKPLQVWCAAKGIGFSDVTDLERLVMTVDADRFARLLSGLLANALRFTERGVVTLALRSDGATLHLAVSDSGPGIQAGRLHQLLQPRGEAANPGNDIGLAFARAVVDHYRGRIWAESVAGKGSTFHVELPLRRNGPETPGER